MSSMNKDTAKHWKTSNIEIFCITTTSHTHMYILYGKMHDICCTYWFVHLYEYLFLYVYDECIYVSTCICTYVSTCMCVHSTWKNKCKMKTRLCNWMFVSCHHKPLNIPAEVHVVSNKTSNDMTAEARDCWEATSQNRDPWMTHCSLGMFLSQDLVEQAWNLVDAFPSLHQ